MNIALIGYGKMGKAIEVIALQKKHTMGLIIDTHNSADFNKDNFSSIDVAIEFTTPETAIENLNKCFEIGIPVVCGTTGWLNHEAEIKENCQKYNGTLLYASNFSIGVNLFFELNTYLAVLMEKHTNYNIHLTEIHHTQKKDAPSGTAISLANQIIDKNGHKSGWINEESLEKNLLEIESKRIDPAPGTHLIKYSSFEDDIEIIHTAHNRNGFASGAILAAEFIYNKKGIFTMKDVLGL